MRHRRILAALILFLPSLLCAASCIQQDETSVEMVAAGNHAAELGGVASLAADPRLLALCVALAPAPVAAKVAFCDSLPDTGMYARCMSHRWNRVEWIGWCYFEFSD